MRYEDFFQGQLTRLHEEGNYRVFADLERHKGAFPSATNRVGEAVREVTIGVPMIIWAWVSIRMFWPQCMRRWM